MSRIGKAPIAVPSGVDISIANGAITIKGPKGALSRPIPGEIIVRQEESTLLVERPNDERENRSLHGLTRTLVANMVQGVTSGFVKELDIVGVGYRAANIRSIRKPEPYKGKGVRYVDERIIRKAGKAGKK